MKKTIVLTIIFCFATIVQVAAQCTPPSAGGFAWTDRYQPLIYSLGAHPYDLEFTSLSGSDLQYEWHYNYTGEVNPSDPIYTGPGWNQKNLNPPTNTLGDVYYWCRVYNDCGSDNSEIAFVRIVNCSMDGFQVSISGPTTVTEGNVLRLEMQYPAANGGYKTLKWYHDGNLISTRGWPEDSIHSGTLYDAEPQRQASILTINPCSMSDGGCYYCVLQDGQSCSLTSNQICVTVNPSVTPIVNHPTQTVCIGDVVTLTGYTTGPWSWDNGATTKTITANTSAAGTTTYKCTTAGQIDIYTIIVENCTPPTVNHPAQTVCIGDVVTLTGYTTGPWNWDNGATTKTITANTSAVGTTTYTCTTSTQIDVYTIIVKDCTPEPCQELIYCKWNDVLFINNADSIFVAYQWYRDGQKLEGETRQFYYTHGESMSGDGHEYSAYAFKADGSSVEACAKAFSAFTRSADQNPGERRNVQVYPNPVQRNMPVRIIGMGEQPSLMVYSATGQRVAEYSGDTFVPNLPAGCYLLYATDSENEPYCQTLIVQ